MTDIQYVGELLIPRQIGHLGVVLAFVAAATAAIAYTIATNKRDTLDGTSWQKLGRWAFGIHSLGIVTVIACIFYVMIEKRFEYFYAHSHVNNELQFRYIFAAFWEGQEGSFLLWLFWHVVLGGVLILRGGKNWESPVLAVVSMAQTLIGSMILGLHFGIGEHLIKWGSNPILLMREVNDIPLFADPNYIAKIAKTAKGLNPLLQNAWMTIHPPTLFLGFASTTIPFAFAIAGLWTRQYTEWLRPTLRWALFSGGILGTGIAMGGMWAYEALSFNGYWAWDPVENMSLVPWLVLIAGLHTHLVARATGHSLRATFVFYALSFLLVLYSTFLTRSGILGDTSAHAFTEMGLEWQLVLLQAFFILLSVGFIGLRWSEIPNPKKDEAISSREFWLFIGSLVLLMSVVMISFTTSIPVYNKILGFFMKNPPKFTAPVDVVAHYNATQLWIGIAMGFLSAFAQFLRYKETNFEKWRIKFAKSIGIALVLSAVATVLSVYFWIENMGAWQYKLLLFAGFFTTIANVMFCFSFLWKNAKAAGSAIAHIGFGTMLLGIIASGVDKRWISNNRFAMEGLINFTDEQFNKNILLMKGYPMMMNGYEVEYKEDVYSEFNKRRDFKLIFREKTKDLKTTVDSFEVSPYILYDKKTGKIASTNPDTRHFWNFDVFSHIAALPPTEQDPEIAHKMEDSLQYRRIEMGLGKTFVPERTLPKTPQYSVTIDSFNMSPKHPKYEAEPDDIAVGIKMTIRRGDTVLKAEPIVLARENAVFQLPATVNTLGLRIKVGADLFDRLFEKQDPTQYKEYAFAQGETVKIGDKNVTFEGIDAQPKVENVDLQPTDLAFAANLSVHTEGGQVFSAKPVYIIRGTQPMPLPDMQNGLTFFISKIDPNSRKMYIRIGERKLDIPVDIAEDAPRTDYLVLEATRNPSINWVWFGMGSMMFGLFWAMFFRWREKKNLE